MPISPEVADIIRQKKALYCRAADSNQWHLFDNIMLPDATYIFVDSDDKVISQGGVDYSFSSREEWRTFFSNAFKVLQTIHLVGYGELEQTGPDEVKATFGVVYHAGTKGNGPGLHETGGGHYYETWKRQGDDWFMQDMRMQRLYWKTTSS